MPVYHENEWRLSSTVHMLQINQKLLLFHVKVNYGIMKSWLILTWCNPRWPNWLASYLRQCCMCGLVNFNFQYKFFRKACRANFVQAVNRSNFMYSSPDLLVNLSCEDRLCNLELPTCTEIVAYQKRTFRFSCISWLLIEQIRFLICTAVICTRWSRIIYMRLVQIVIWIQFLKK